MKRVGLVEGQSMTSQSRWYNPGQRVMKEKYTLAVCLQVGSENELAALSLLFLSHSGKYILFGQCVEYLAKHILTFFNAAASWDLPLKFGIIPKKIFCMTSDLLTGFESERSF